jgi:TrpR-related protein YerC/YecD
MKQDTSLKNIRADKWIEPETVELFDALLALKTREEAARFLRDLLTSDELSEFANRWKAAQMLADNNNYKAIEGETGLSSRTIARISKWLKGGMGGYQLMLRKMHSHHAVHTMSLPGSGLR